MTQFPFDIVGFDLDGTLVDSVLDIAPAIDHALATIDRDPVPADKTRDLIGGGSEKMLKRALDITGGPVSPERFAALFEILLTHYEAHIADRTVPYDGCLEALDELAARGCTLAVLTNKAEHPARKLLSELGISERFASILGGDSLGPGRSKPEPDMIAHTIEACGGGSFAMVGDSTYDVRAARAAEVPVVTVSFGYNDVPVPELGGDVLIDHYRDLVPALEKL